MRAGLDMLEGWRNSWSEGIGVVWLTANLVTGDRHSYLVSGILQGQGRYAFNMFDDKISVIT